jgi:ribulose-phosphate 3-epimerase
VEEYVDWIQLDIMDGQFVDNSTWNNPAELKKLETEVNLEVHLMIKNPEEMIDQWIDSGVKRIIIHFESTRHHHQLINKIKEAGLGVGLAINPDTPIEMVDNFISDLDLVLVMTVQPGRGGQELLEDTLVKIKQLREIYPNVNIEVDGGINLETASQVIQAGANLLASGSAVFDSDNIEETIRKLKSFQ